MSGLERAGWITGAALSAALFYASWRHLIPSDPVEVLGFVAGGACVWLAVRENIWNWPIGIANNVFYVVVFLQARLFADMSLQLAFAVLGFYGWYMWLFGGEARTEERVSRTPWPQWIALSAACAAATWGASVYLATVKDAAPFLDALITAMSLVAQYMLTRKYLENWFVWMAVDVISIGLYAVKHLGLTAVLYAIYLAMCVAGASQWRRSMTAHETTLQPAHA
jgi:nicotinamide mononucleotide transporter